MTSDKPKTAFELAMERLNAEDKEAGTKETPLTARQKEAIAEARRVASSRLAEREILFRDSMLKTPDPETRAKAEAEYQVDRQRINDDCERAVDAIRRGDR
jgi:anthranilate/para-aminobenzoate synthase component I